MPNWRHSTAIFSPSSSRAINLSRSSIWLHSFQGTFALLAKGPVCNPCLRNELSPVSQEGHNDTVSFRLRRNSSDISAGTKRFISTGGAASHRSETLSALRRATSSVEDQD